MFGNFFFKATKSENSNTNHVIILRRIGSLFCSLKRTHASMEMPACTLSNEQNKGPNLLSISTLSVLGKQNAQAEKVYSRNNLRPSNLINFKPGFHIVVSVVSVVSVVRKKFIGEIQLYGNLPYNCSIQ